MEIRKINEQQFIDFAEKHPLRNYQQTPMYAKYMESKGYNFEYIGLFDNNNLIAASLILFKKLGFINKYGYAPKGFLIDYYNNQLVFEFQKLLIKFYHKRNFSFIKFNPEIAIGEINTNNKFIPNANYYLKYNFVNNGFINLSENKLFENIQPKYNAIINLKKYNFNNITKPFKTKIRKAKRNGLSIFKCNEAYLDEFFKFVKNKGNRSLKDYRNYFDSFKENIELFLINLDIEAFLNDTRLKYNAELDRNAKLTDILMKKNTIKNLKKKMESDKQLNIYKDDLVFATNEFSKHSNIYIAGAVVIKYQNRVNIISTGYNKKYNRLYPNHFIHYELIKHYKKNFDFIDLNGITGDFTENNPYNGLNNFKISFNPRCFEYIGEYDIVINKGLYKGMSRCGLIKSEFSKKQKKK